MKQIHASRPNVNFASSKADSYSIEFNQRYGTYSIYGWGRYESGVLRGQTKKFFIESFDTEAEAIKIYPKAKLGYRSAHNTFNHLPGENDPVPGGMYPDDIEDGI